jgi:hypothetical protein
VLDKAGIRSDQAWISVCATDGEAIEAVRKHLAARPA